MSSVVVNFLKNYIKLQLIIELEVKPEFIELGTLPESKMLGVVVSKLGTDGALKKGCTPI